MQPKAAAAFQNSLAKKPSKKAVQYPLILGKTEAYSLG